MYPAQKRKSPLKIVLIVFTVLAFIAGGYFGWQWYMERSEDEASSQQVDEVPEPEPEVVELVEFDSDNPRLSFQHPSTWEVTEQDGTLRVVSPQISYQTVDGVEIDGHFRIFMRQTAREEDAQYIGRGVASLPSETLTYTDPSANQREETSISFFGIDNSTNFGFFFVAGNFTLAPGDILGGNYGREQGTYIIGGGYSSDELQDDLQTHPVLLDRFDQTEAYEQALEIIRSIRIG